MSVGGGVYKAPGNGLDSGCEVVQIFTRNQMQWQVKELAAADVQKFQEAVKHTGVEVVSVHASYLINLASFDTQKLQKSRENLLIEMQRAELLGIPYLIVHPGSHMGAGEVKGMRRIAESLNAVFSACPEFQLTVLLEATAGQGSNLGYTFEQLAEIKAGVDTRERVAFCIDTCHIFAAGYELRSQQGYSETMQQLDATLGAEHVRVIHANDSKKALGSRLDRHAHIGDGELGLEAFANLVNDARFTEASVIIETPGGPEQDRENLQKLRDLVS